MNKKSIIPALILLSCILIIILFIFIFDPFESKKPKIYNSDYTSEEIKFGDEKVFPNAKTPEDMIKTFAESLEKKDKQTTKLLSSPEFKTIPPEMWNQRFDGFWEKHQGSKIIYSEIKYNREGGCQKGFKITTQDKIVNEKFVCVNKNYYGWENRDQVLNEFKSYYTLSLVWD